MTRKVSRARRRRVIDALGRGTVPQSDLDLFAVGMERFEKVLTEELEAVAAGGSGFKAVRGEYGSGKTFFARWLAEKAKRMRMAASEVQISDRITPLHRLETVYRAVVAGLSTSSATSGALRDIVDEWLLVLESDAESIKGVSRDDRRSMAVAVDELIESRLKDAARDAPAFATALRFYRKARLSGDQALADGLLAWAGGEPNVAANVRRQAGIKGEIDSGSALGFLRGLLTVLRECGYSGLIVVLDEIETIQRMRSDIREKSLNALRQLIDEIDKGGLPGLYLVITGTPAFFEGQQGVQRLTPLAQRLAVDFDTDERFDSVRQVQIRLRGFDRDQLVRLGCAVRDLYAQGDPAEERIMRLVDDAYVKELATAVAGQLGVGAAPRVFLRKLVSDIMYRVSEHPDFDPRLHYRKVRIAESDLNEHERDAYRRLTSADEVELDLT